LEPGERGLKGYLNRFGARKMEEITEKGSRCTERGGEIDQSFGAGNEVGEVKELLEQPGGNCDRPRRRNGVKLRWWGSWKEKWHFEKPTLTIAGGRLT